MCVIFVVHRVPNAPSGEWVTGIEAAPIVSSHHGIFHRERCSNGRGRHERLPCAAILQSLTNTPADGLSPHQLLSGRSRFIFRRERGR